MESPLVCQYPGYKYRLIEQFIKLIIEIRQARECKEGFRSTNKSVLIVNPAFHLHIIKIKRTVLYIMESIVGKEISNGSRI
ncbi:MAG: hypothetical protein A2Y53_00530 [Chloroflexi bacterium RBG_16_47_49]|nr:MAG: hypothetical protein A2Y53_00530 [Chloroflexi bacterium RBG_16_47_49]